MNDEVKNTLDKISKTKIKVNKDENGGFDLSIHIPANSKEMCKIVNKDGEERPDYKDIIDAVIYGIELLRNNKND